MQVILRVLVVDDNNVVRGLICKILRSQGTFRSSVKLRMERKLSVRSVTTGRMSCYSTSRCQ